MKIKITTDELEPGYSRGQIVDVPGVEGVPLLQAGYAEAVAGPVLETAVQPDAARRAVEDELSAMGVFFLRGANLDSLTALRDASRAPVDPLDHDGDGRKGGSRRKTGSL